MDDRKHTVTDWVLKQGHKLSDGDKITIPHYLVSIFTAKFVLPVGLFILYNVQLSGERYFENVIAVYVCMAVQTVQV